MPATHETNFKPNPMQRSFIESKAQADLFSSRRGEGKSTGLAWSIAYHTRHNPGANWAMVRDTYENLQKTTMKTFFEWFPPGVYGTWHQTKKEFTWAEGFAKGTVSFVGMDDPHDASRFLSWELAGIVMDEPAPAVGSSGIDEMIFDLGMTCLRQQGMKWYSMKLAENNPDESHWTYRKFVSPGLEGFSLWQPPQPENLLHLPSDYYENMRRTLAHRPDLVRRFVDGEFGFQQEGKQVTPQWNDRLHLANGLIAIPRQELILLWDFGHNPTCLVTQKTPLGHWNILESLVGDGIGVEELIQDGVKPLLQERYYKHPLRHIGDPAGRAGEQTSIRRNAVQSIRNALGGPWRDGPVRIRERIEPLRAVLARTINGQAVVRVDRQKAKEVWWAMRGGWHFHVSRTGIVSGDPVKNEHSHPADALSYGAAILFPMGKVYDRQGLANSQNAPYTGYFGSAQNGWRIGPQVSNYPKDGDKL